MFLLFRKLYYLYIKQVLTIVLSYFYLISYFYNKKSEIVSSFNIIIFKKVISSLDILNKD
jgi:hypothetical protein